MKERALEREKRTIRVMIGMYCRRRHGVAEALCHRCDALLGYALERIERCPCKDAKPACSKCTIHCYAPAMREEIRGVMRFAGPRMLIAHPLLVALHFKDRILYSAKHKIDD